MSTVLTNLVDAVIEGRIVDVKSILTQTNGAGINYCNSDGVSLLSRAISHGHTDIAMVLMSYGGRLHVNARDRSGFTALHRACWHLPPLATLSAAPDACELDDPAMDNEPTSARTAVSQDDVVVETAATPPPAPKRKSVVVQSPIGQRGGGSRDGGSRTKDAPVVRPAYTAPEPKVVSVPPIPLHKAPSVHPRSARSSARESARSFPPLRPFGNSHTAIDVLVRLLDLGAKIDDINPTPAATISIQEGVAALDRLPENDDATEEETSPEPPLRTNSQSLIESAADTLQPSTSQESHPLPILQSPSLFPFKSGTGRTPLILAALRGDVAVTRLLVERGADVAYTDRNGLTAIDYAAYFGNVELVRYLGECQSEALEGDGRATLRARQCAMAGSSRARTNNDRHDFTVINSILTAAVSSQSRVSVR